ncbi:MAG: DUF721 domain-containing protein [Treponema sp.]|jgi:hypothetical protein|nr:DUF721 domain-containing protein [Treponema sp.]
MKTAGNILSTLFDEGFVKKAQGYSKLFDSWVDITTKNGIAAAADHSRIKDLDRGILLVEMDHPGWKQILQTKQAKLLNDFRYRFPDMDISGISLMLGRSEPQEETISGKEQNEETAKRETMTEDPPQADFVGEPIAGYDAIKDEEFKEMLKKLGQSIAVKEKRNL